MLDEICMWLMHRLPSFDLCTFVFQRATMQLCVSEYLWPANKKNPFPALTASSSSPSSSSSSPDWPFSISLSLPLSLSSVCAVVCRDAVHCNSSLNPPTSLSQCTAPTQSPTPDTHTPIPYNLIPTPVITVLWGSAVVETWSLCASRAAFYQAAKQLPFTH